MANKIQFVITAQDQASGPIGKVKGALQQLGNQVKNGKLDKVSEAISGGLSSGSGAVSAVTRFVSGSTLATGAITGLVLKLAQLESQWASSVRGMNNLGVRSGLPTTTAYGVQYAGRLAGLSAEQTNSGIEQVRQTYSDALNNRNPEALKRYQAAGISTDPGRMESIESVLQKLAAYSETLREQGKYGGAQNFLNAAGASSLADFLNRGPAQVAADLQTAKSYIPTDDDIRRAREYADASARLGVTYDRLKVSILSFLEPGFEGILSSLQAGVDAFRGQRPNAQPNGSDSMEQRIWDGFERFGNQLRGRGDETMAQTREKTSVGDGGKLEQARADVEWYMNHGLSRERAIGLVANISRESGFDERAVGDNGRAVGLFQLHPDRQRIYEQKFGRPYEYTSHEEQLGYSLLELQTNERVAGNALMATTSAADAAAKVASLYERPKDPKEAAVRAGIAQQLDDQLTAVRSDGGKVTVEIVHKNAPPGTSVNVSSTPGVETSMKTDRQAAPLGDHYAYSPSNF